MKQIMLVLPIFFSLQAPCQDINQLNGYKYAIVNTLISADQEIDKYQIGSNVRKHLFDKGFNVFNENEITWPNELFDNRCLAFYCNIDASDKLLSKYQITISFKNCNNQTFYSGTGKGVGVTVMEAFFNATEAALNDFDSFNYKFNSVLADDLEFSRQKNLVEGQYDAINIKGLSINIDWKEDEIYSAVINATSNKNYTKGAILFELKKSNISDQVFTVKWLSQEGINYLANVDESGKLTVEAPESMDVGKITFKKNE